MRLFEKNPSCTPLPPLPSTLCIKQAAVSDRQCCSRSAACDQSSCKSHLSSIALLPVAGGTDEEIALSVIADFRVFFGIVSRCWVWFYCRIFVLCSSKDFVIKESLIGECVESSCLIGYSDLFVYIIYVSYITILKSQSGKSLKYFQDVFNYAVLTFIWLIEGRCQKIDRIQFNLNYDKFFV